MQIVETYRLAGLRRFRLAVRPDDVHGNGLGCGGPQQTPAAAQGVGSEDEEDEAADNLDDAIHARSKELHSRAGHAEGAEDLGSVVVLCKTRVVSAPLFVLEVCTGSNKPYNRVDASHLLPDHEHDADDSPLAVSGNQPHLLEQSLGRRIADQPPLVLELLSHILNLALHVRVIRWEVSQLHNDLGRGIPVVLLSGPAGTLWYHEHENDEQACKRD